MKKISKIFPALLLEALTLTSCAPPVATGEVQKHNVLHWEIVTEVGCESEGYRFGMCVDCKNEVRDVMAPLGHDFREGFCVRCKKEDSSWKGNSSLPNECFKLSADKNGYILVKWGGPFSRLVRIPSEHNGLPVVAIGENVFFDNEAIEEVVIPDSVVDIGNCAFRECSSLVKIEMGKNAALLGEAAFEGCVSLEEIILPDTLKTIRSSCFRGCTSLQKVVADGCTYIGDSAFMGCKQLYDFDFPETLKYIGEDAFRLSAFLSAELPDGIEEIGAWAFADTPVKTVVIPKGLVNGGKSIFLSCNELTEATVKSNYIFQEFANCEKLETIRFTSDVTHLTGQNVSVCKNVKTVYLPKELEAVNETFYHLRKVERIVYPGTMSEFLKIEGVQHVFLVNTYAVLECSDQSVTCGVFNENQ